MSTNPSSPTAEGFASKANAIQENLPPYLVLSCKCNLPKDTTNPETKETEIWEAEISLQLKKRGFLVEEVIHGNGMHSFLLSIEKRRLQILDSERSQIGFATLAHRDRFKLAQDSLYILNRLINKNFGISELTEGYLGRHKNQLKSQWSAWISHEANVMSTVTTDVRTIRDYFGCKNAMYFAFLDYYTWCLLFLAILGGLVFTNEMKSSPNIPFHFSTIFEYISNVNIDSIYLPWFALIQAIWGCLFMTLWRRRENNTLQKWNIDEVFEIQRVRESDHEIQRESIPDTLKRIRVFLSFSVSILCLVPAVWIIYKSYQLELDLSGKKKIKFLGVAVPITSSLCALFRVLFPVFAAPLYDYIISWTVSFENHKNPIDDNHNVVVKKFLFHFVCNYCNLFYIAFYKQDLKELRSSLVFILTINAIISTASEFSLLKSSKTSKGAPLLVLLQNEIKLSNFDVDSEFLELLIQFGFVSMFSVVFPLAAVFAYINNLFEGSIDLSKMLTSKRYGLQLNRCRIGAWQLCFEVVSFVSIFTNLFFLCICSKHLSQITPKFLDKLAQESLAFKLVLMFFLEHVILMVRYMIGAIFCSESSPYSNVSSDVGSKNALSPSPMKERRRSSMSSLFSVPSPVAASSSGRNSPSTLLNQSSDSLNVERSFRSPNVKYTDELIPFCTDPMFFFFPFALGPLLSSMGVSIWLYMPIVLCVTVYWNINHDKEAKRKALSLSCDEKALKILLKSLPTWIDSSVHQRVEWLNSVLGSIWPFFSQALARVIQGVVNPILADVCKSIPILSELNIEDITFGSIAPHIASVTICPTSELAAIIDLDILWASDILAMLKVGLRILPAPISIELSKVNLRGTIRIELLNFTNAGLACFEFLTVSFVKEPKINFSLKLSSLDVMNIGISSDYNLTAIIEELLKSILSSIMVYPKKIIIPMYAEADLDALQNPTPNGLLIISKLRCCGLKAADLNGKSDPFVKIKLSHGNAEQTTKVIYKTLDPSWDSETYEFLIANRKKEVIKFEIYDYDDFSSADSIGFCEIPFSDIFGNGNSNISLGTPLAIFDDEKLTVRGKGTLQFESQFIVLMSSDDKDLFSEDELARRLSNVDLIDDSTSLLDKQDIVNVGLLTVSGIQCENLKPQKKSGILSSSPRPIKAYALVEIFVEGRLVMTKRTASALKGVQNPNFDEILPFVLKDTHPQDIDINVSVYDDRHSSFSMKGDKLLGFYKLPLSEIVQDDAKYAVAFKKRQPLDIGIGQKGGDIREISMKLEWRVAKSHI